jgi:hypothetical protein
MTKLSAITSHATANDFFNYMANHTEYKKLNGFNLVRLEDGRVSLLKFGDTEHYFDIEYIYKERAMFNDWINTFCQ